jgi:hypothetical protein
MARNWETELEKLAGALGSALGEGLVSLLLYGSAARPGATAQASDVNVLLIVRDASSAGLRPVAQAIAGWVRADYAPPLVFDEAEWRGSADVFPIEIEDMREAHRVLRGADPFAGMTTTLADLRSELEREVRSKLLHLRTAYAAAAPDGRMLEELLEHSSGTIMSLLRAALRVAGRPVPAALRDQAAAAATLVGFEPAAFEWIVAQQGAAAGGARPGRLTPYDIRATSYIDAVQQLAAWVDGATS